MELFLFIFYARQLPVDVFTNLFHLSKNANFILSALTVVFSFSIMENIYPFHSFSFSTERHQQSEVASRTTTNFEPPPAVMTVITEPFDPSLDRATSRHPTIKQESLFLILVSITKKKNSQLAE